MLDYKKMVSDIDYLVNNYFCADMEMRLIPNSQKYTQEESKKMSDIIARVYSISHCISCSACSQKYKI